MSRQPTHVNTGDGGWVNTMTPEVARVAGVPQGPLVVFHFSEVMVAAVVMPRPSG